MIDSLKKFIDNSQTAYQAVQTLKNRLLGDGYVMLNEGDEFKIEQGKKYFVVRDGSSLIAFKVGNIDNYYYKIIASHTDSPALKIKFDGENVNLDCRKLETEVYGGPILYSFFDRPLKVAGRVVVERDGKIVSVPVVAKTNVVLPSVAVHLQRQVNSSFAPNAQTDMQPLCGLGVDKIYIDDITKDVLCKNDKIYDYDLFVTCAQEGFFSGANDEFFSSPRIDNLASVISSIEALEKSDGDGISVACLYDNEEVGSGTKQGAAGDFLYETLKRVNRSLKKSDDEFSAAVFKSFMLSCDGAHATHPNHAELSCQPGKIYLGKGVVIKHHANQNYTTDAVSSSVIKKILQNEKISYQDFFMRSDMPCGSTLGAISSRHLSLRSVDVGVAQLSMHSQVETIATSDYGNLVEALTAFLNAKINQTAYDEITVETK